ncbi:MAG TPA: hypothetical protein VJK50_02230, partial [Patescibacteria group bacterium]|nr:hypothetical protein [Patescibacteria group bacterium]
MATIADYFEQAQLSMAAYAVGLQPGMFGGSEGSPYHTALIGAGMSSSQATKFAATYSVIDQYTDFFSGFSGTVFADSSGTKYFAMRGSEASIIDWIGTNFGNIGTDGIAISQGIALFNWLQRLFGSNGIDVVQYSYSAITRTISTFADTANGRLVGQTTPMSVAGHSLGGHLAMIMSRLAPGKVSSVYTYNAPGFDPFGTGLTSEGFFDLLRNAPLGLTGSIGTTWNNAPMSNWNVAGDIVHNIGFTPGDPGIIFSESANQGTYDAHIKEPIVDSLAIYNLFATLDPTLNTNP